MKFRWNFKTLSTVKTLFRGFLWFPLKESTFSNLYNLRDPEGSNCREEFRSLPIFWVLLPWGRILGTAIECKFFRKLKEPERFENDGIIKAERSITSRALFLVETTSMTRDFNHHIWNIQVHCESKAIKQWQRIYLQSQRQFEIEVAAPLWNEQHKWKVNNEIEKYITVRVRIWFDSWCREVCLSINNELNVVTRNLMKHSEEGSAGSNVKSYTFERLSFSKVTELSATFVLLR